MDKLSTTFSTLCLLKSSSDCCLNHDESFLAFQKLKKFIYDQGCSINTSFETINPAGFRLKAKLAVRKEGDKVVIGLFKEGTHDVIDKQGCMLHHPLINETLGVLKDLIKQLKIEPYDEKTHKGIIRYVQLLVNQAGAVQVVLVVNGISDETKKLAFSLNEKIPNISIWLNIQNKITNTIFSEHFEHLYGVNLFSYELMNKEIFFHPGAFCQANVIEFSKIIQLIDENLKKSTKALDLYSGVGLFGLCLEKHFEEIIFAETNPFSYEAFKVTAQALNFQKGQFIVQDAKEVLKNHLDADVVFIDPPRKGLEKAIKPLLGSLKAGTLVFYISCGNESLMRDLNELFPLGFNLKLAKSYQFFPGSKEIETLCILQKTF